MTKIGGRGAATAAALLLLASAGHAGETELQSLARRAVSQDPNEAREARERLRAAGPHGLDVLLEVHAAVLDQAAGGDLGRRARAAAEAVAAQRHAADSRLFWYTDLEQAKARARETGRPILALRLLGRLDEELSCANSRFFRTVLYANREVSDVLRARFVLHWSSERPAPRVTVDFGDGRKLQGTLTGNSAHYVLDSEGRPVDVFPGLYGPRAFLRGLQHAESAALTAARLGVGARDTLLRHYHGERLRNLTLAWTREAAAAGLDTPPPWREDVPVAGASLVDERPRAVDADRRAVAKSLVERPILRAVLGRKAGGPPAPDTDPWRELATRRLPDVHLDSGALERMRQDGVDLGAEPSTILAFRLAIAEDTVRNEYELHSRAHRWFTDGTGLVDFESLNARVYAELFLTPRTDPWLGLVPPGAYSALARSTRAAR